MTDQTSSPEPTATEDAPRRPRRRKRKWVVLLLVLLALLVALAAFAPTLVSTETGTRLTVDFVNDRIAGRIAVDDLNIGWFTGPSADGLVVFDPQGEEVMRAASLAVPEASLISLVRGTSNYGRIAADRPVVLLRQYADGSTNFGHAFASVESSESRDESTSDEPSEPSEPIRLGLALSEGQFTYIREGDPPIRVTGLNSSLAINGLNDIRVEQLVADIARGEAAPGSLELSGSVRELFADNGSLSLDIAVFDVSATLTDLPTAVIDSTANLDGLIASLVGPTITRGRLVLTGTIANLDVRLTNQSEHLQTDLVMKITEGRLTRAGEEDSYVRLDVTPGAWTSVMNALGRPEAPQLTETVRINMPLTRLDLQLLGDDGGVRPRWYDAIVQLEPSVSDVVLDSGGDVGTIALREIHLNLETDREAGLGKQLRLNLDARAEQNETAGRVDVALNLDNAWSETGGFSADTVVANLRGTVSGAAPVIIDQIAGLEGRIVAMLGEMLDVTVSGDLKPGGEGEGLASVTGQFTVSAKSYARGAADRPRAEVRLNGNVADGRATVTPGEVGTVRVNQALLDAIKQLGGAWPEPWNGLRLDSPATLTMQVDRAAIPLAMLTEPGGADKPEFGGKLTIDRLSPRGVEALTDTTLSDVALVVPRMKWGETLEAELTANLTSNGRSGKLTAKVGPYAMDQPALPPIVFQTQQMPTGLVAALAQLDPIYVDLIGDRIDAATVNVAQVAGRDDVFDIVVDLQSPGVTSKIEARYDPAAGVTLGELAFIEATLSPALARQLIGDESPLAAWRLDQPVRIELRAPNAVIGLTRRGDATAFDPRRSNLKVELTGSSASLRNPTDNKQIDLRKLTGSLTSEDLTDRIFLDLTSQVIFPDRPPSELSVDGNVRQLFDASGRMQTTRAQGQVTAKVLRVPVDAVEQLLDQPGAITLYTGANMQYGEVVVRSKAGDGFDVIADVKSDNLTMKLPTEWIPDKHVRLTEKVTGALTLQPATLRELRRRAGGESSALAYDLLEPTEFQLTLSRAKLPMRRDDAGALAVELERVLLHAVLTAESVTVERREPRSRAGAADVRIAVSTEAPAQLITVEASGDLWVAQDLSAPPTQGKLGSTTRVRGLLDEQGKVSIDSLNLTTDTTATAVPIGAIDTLVQANGQLVSILGDTGEVRVVGEYPGELDVNIITDKALANFPLRTRGESTTLRLAENAVVELSAVDEIGDWLATLSPMLVGIKAAPDTKPLRLTLFATDAESEVDGEVLGFAVPMRPFDLNKIRLSGKLEISELMVNRRASWLLAPIFQSMGDVAKALTIFNRDEIKASFTTLRFQISDGVVSTNDLWLSAEELVVGSKARVYLTQDAAKRANITWKPAEGEAWQPYAAAPVAISGQTINSVYQPQNLVRGFPVLGGLAQKIPTLDLLVDPESVFELPAAEGPASNPRLNAGPLGGLGRLAVDVMTSRLLVGSLLGAQGNEEDVRRDFRSKARGRGLNPEESDWPNHPVPKALREAEAKVSDAEEGAATEPPAEEGEAADQPAEDGQDAEQPTDNSVDEKEERRRPGDNIRDVIDIFGDL